jgi:hypothetical protein
MDLQFDFIKSDGGAHHALSSHDRVMAYIREFNRGNLQLLCGLHNREKYQKERRQASAGVVVFDSVGRASVAAKDNTPA